MKSKIVYTRVEAEEIIQLIGEKLESDTQKQKSIRGKIRNRGFWASEFGFRDGYTVDNFLSVVQIIDGRGESPSATVRRIVSDPQVAISRNTSKPGRTITDEAYIIDLCDELLSVKALRQHRFDFLRGDAGTKLPVDAFYPSLNLVIEYRERQHTEAVNFFDRRQTVSGMGRGEQRKKYDQLRRDLIPEHGIQLVELGYDDFDHTSGKRLKRDRVKDLVVLGSFLKIHI